jgi:release factor glutamine methyltransferase
VTLGQVLRRSTDYLATREIQTPRLDAELLLAKALGLSRLELYLEHDRPLTLDELDACRKLIGRRARREPAAYILGEWGFRRLTLGVDRRVLVPRPETETVVEWCLELLADVPSPRVLDAGTGSGAIGLAIADERADATITAFDVSADALAVARENARKVGVTDRVAFIEGDFRAGLGEGPFDLVVSNPPYVGVDELERLQAEVRDWEPRVALVGGLPEAVAIARGARVALVKGGWLVLETSEQLAADVSRAVREEGFAETSVRSDLNGRPRVVAGRRIGGSG